MLHNDDDSKGVMNTTQKSLKKLSNTFEVYIICG